MALFLLVLLIHPQPPLLDPGSAAPPVRLATADGGTDQAVGGAAGHTAVIAFLQTGCGTCVQQLPALCGLAQQQAPARFAVVDSAGEPAAALRALRSGHAPASCPVQFLVDPGLAVTRAYRVSVVPCYYVVDTTGHIAFAGFGQSALQALPSILQRVVHAG